MSELRTNRIVPRDGLPAGSAGGIIQVKQVTTDQQVEASFASETNLLSLSITPTRSDSKILVCINCCGVGSRSTGSRLSLRVKRDSTRIWAIGNYVGNQHNSGSECHPNGMYLDSPATTSAVTYTLTGTRTKGSDNCYFNHMDSTGVGSQAGSSMTLMEVSG